MEKAIKVFVSSTYMDLKDQRDTVAKSINDNEAIPGIVFKSVVMERFHASNRPTLDYIKEKISQCQYYILIIGARYGSIDPKSGLSFTEQEYDYAIKEGIPVLAFIHSEPTKLPQEYVDPENAEKLENFRKKILDNGKHTMYWYEDGKLPTDVNNSLIEQYQFESNGTENHQSPPPPHNSLGIKFTTFSDGRKLVFLFFIIVLITAIIVLITEGQPPVAPPTEPPFNIITQPPSPTADLAVLSNSLATTAPTEPPTAEPPQPNTTQTAPTPVPTDNREPTPTSTYDFIVGVFEQNSNCGEKDKNYIIIPGLRDLNFEVEEIPIGTTDYDRFRVLYMPYGWSCTLKDYNLESISDFLYRTSTGLLIGDPRPEELITLRLFSYKIYFDSLSPEAVSSLGPPVFDNDEMKIKYSHIFAGFYDDDLPAAETKLSLPKDAEGYHRVVIQYGKNEYKGWYNSFVASSNVTPRYVIMPGSEYAVNEDGISDDLMIKIIEWLAHSSTSK